MVRSGCCGIERFQLDRFRRGALELLGHHLAVPGLDHDPVAAADRRCRRHQDDVAVAIGRLHRLAGHFERIGVLVVDRRKCDFVPAVAGRKAAVVEIAAGAGLGEAEQRHAAGRRARRVALDQVRRRSRCVRAGRRQRLADQFGRRPARAAGRRDALGFVERGGIEAGAPGKARSRKPGPRGEAIDRRPDLRVREHRSPSYNPADDRNYCLQRSRADRVAPPTCERAARDDDLQNLRADGMARGRSRRRGFADRTSIDATASSISRPRRKSPRRRPSISPDRPT